MQIGFRTRMIFTDITVKYIKLYESLKLCPAINTTWINCMQLNLYRRIIHPLTFKRVDEVATDFLDSKVLFI